MSDEVSAPTTLAIILGASEWPYAPVLSGGTAYTNSAAGFKEYLSQQFGLQPANILDLFDDKRSPTDLDAAITEFLRGRLQTLNNAKAPARDLIFYYVGHGGFVGPDYYLALHTTRAEREGISSLRMRDLARTLTDEARLLRRYLILDCCFAAAAYEEFQSAPADVATRRTLEHFPKQGTAMLCASGPRDPARVPKDGRQTIFTGAMLSVLRTGVHNRDRQLSLKDLGDETAAFLRESFPDELARPEVHSPDQTEGDIAEVGLFPNATHMQIDPRIQALSVQVTELTRMIANIETRVAAVEAGRVTAATAGNSVQSGGGDDALEQSTTVRRPAADRFFLTDAEWMAIPASVRVWMQKCRRTTTFGIVWLVIALVLLGISVTMMLWQTFAFAAIWTMVIFHAAAVVLTFFGLIQWWFTTRSGDVEGLEIPPRPTEPWQSYDAVLRCAASRSFKIFGGLNIASPYFEIGAIVIVISAILMAFSVTILPAHPRK
jgi:hypothetical protein